MALFTEIYTMRVIITAATTGEWMPAFVALPEVYRGISQRLKVSFAQTGVGMLASSFALTRLVLTEKPDLVIQAGIAGSFLADWPSASVLAVSDEYLGDTGVFENNEWKDLFDLQLEKKSYPPFEKRKLPNPWLGTYNVLGLPTVKAITVNEISTQKERIKVLQKKYQPVLESMEGAALHYVCRSLQVPFLQVRAVSNRVGERDKSKWQMTAAVHELNQFLLQYVDALYQIA
ncbi:MAG: futalosine hydrolase [Sphingobacteriia bacterium]|nr:MAG: futalosine hydrolase [Sphingobacteriia bacterium]